MPICPAAGCRRERRPKSANDYSNVAVLRRSLISKLTSLAIITAGLS
jgi:hypothetical protein